MKIDKEFLKTILTENYEILQVLQKNMHNVRNVNGSVERNLSDTLRLIGVSEVLVNNDIVSFKTNLTQSVKLMITIFVRYNSGDPIDESYISMIRYKNLFDALAVGDFELAREFAALMGGRDEIEKRNDHPFDYAFGYALKAFVLNNRPDMERYSGEFRDICRGGGNFDFAGYAEIFQAILDEDSAAANQAVKSIVKGHVKQTKGRGVF